MFIYLSLLVHLSQPWAGLAWKTVSFQVRVYPEESPKNQTCFSVCCIFFTFILVSHFYEQESSWLLQASSTFSNDPSKSKREHKTLTCVEGGEDKRQNLWSFIKDLIVSNDIINMCYTAWFVVLVPKQVPDNLLPLPWPGRGGKTHLWAVSINSVYLEDDDVLCDEGSEASLTQVSCDVLLSAPALHILGDP